MTPSNAASRPRSGRGAAARPVNFHGLKIEVPKKLPGDLVWELADLEESDGAGFRELRSLLVTLLGPEQTEKIRSVVREKGIELDKLVPEIMDLVGKVVEAAGSDSGKSRGSGRS